jgi:crossover junction endodeoxyribonuclease RuvC
MKYIIGIDPGATGAVAILDHEGDLIEVWDIPTVALGAKGTKKRISPEMLASELRNWQDAAVCYLEQVAARPGQGVSSMFAFGESLGIIRGILAGMSIPVVLVTPAKWKRDMILPTSSKEYSRQRAAQNWPKHAGEFARVKDDGRAEAALLGLWGIKYDKSAAKNR